jgi:hypothetical protein
VAAGLDGSPHQVPLTTSPLSPLPSPLPSPSSPLLSALQDVSGLEEAVEWLRDSMGARSEFGDQLLSIDMEW